MHEITGGNQNGFLHNLSTTDKVFCIRQVAQKNGIILGQYVSRLQVSIKLLIKLGEVLCNILVEFDIAVKLAGKIKMCFNETCNKVQICKYSSDPFPSQDGSKQGGSLPPLHFHVALE